MSHTPWLGVAMARFCKKEKRFKPNQITFIAKVQRDDKLKQKQSFQGQELSVSTNKLTVSYRNSLIFLSLWSTCQNESLPVWAPLEAWLEIKDTILPKVESPVSEILKILHRYSVGKWDMIHID